MHTLNKRFVHRIYSRFLVHFPMMYLGQTVTGQGIVLDLSLVGCQALSNTPVSESTPLSVRLALPSYQEPLVIERATVKWVKGLEFGIAFEHHDERERVRLREVLDELLASRRYSGLTTAAPHTDMPGSRLVTGL
ncbi:MAG: PilZ domain-containing protein [Nitrospira sp.]|nr:PilZ domain-containing protein [Nitrospira sp.]